MRFTRTAPSAFSARKEGELFRDLAHRAFWARAIRLRAAADTLRFGRDPFRVGVTELLPVRASNTEIAESSFSICN